MFDKDLDSRRPMVDAQLRMAAHVPDAEERFTDSVEDTLGAEVNRIASEQGVSTQGGVITSFLRDDEVVFDLHDDVSSVDELNKIQNGIISAFYNYTEVDVHESDIVVHADIVRTFTFGLRD